MTVQNYIGFLDYTRKILIYFTDNQIVTLNLT